MKITTIIAASMLFTLPAMAEEHHTVSWYHAHPAETLAKLQACNDDPGYAKHDPNCENAHEARLAMSVDEGRREIGLMQQKENQQQQQIMMANPQYLLNRMQRCHGLTDPADLRIAGCALVYATAKQYLAANGRQP
ncbi:MAG: EexN family lipoprotein [Rhodopila sp.]